MVEHEQRPSLYDVLGTKDFPSKQRRAIEIIDGLSISPENKRIMFLYHLWHEAGSINPVKKLTGMKSSSDALDLIGKLLEDDELVDQYGNFYSEFLAGNKEKD